MIDAYSTEPQFAAHIEPVFGALSDPGDWDGTHPTRPVIVASYGDVKRVRSLGYTKIARMEHGAGQSYGTKHGSYAGGKDHDDVSLFLVPNQYSADLWQARYPKAQVEIVGCPKLDSLPAKDPAEPLTVAISFHWDCYLVPETVSAFSTFRNAIPQLREAVNLIGHGHPRALIGPPSLTKQYRRMDVPLVTDFDEVCRKADLYVCDNSSSLYEFAATGRPVVVMNSIHYRKDVHHGLRFWDLIPGPQVDRPQDLVATVLQSLQDGPQHREQVMSQVYAYPSGAAQRAASALEEWTAQA